MIRPLQCFAITVSISVLVVSWPMVSHANAEKTAEKAEAARICPWPAPDFWPQRLALEEGHYLLLAEVAAGELGQSLWAQGEVSLFAPGLRIDTESLTFDPEQGQLSAPGRSTFFDGETRLDGSGLELDLVQGSGQMESAEFWIMAPWMRSSAPLPLPGAAPEISLLQYPDPPRTLEAFLQREDRLPRRGSAAQVIRTETGQLVLTDARYTTCPPDQESWSLRAGTLRLDPLAGRGTAQNVTLQAGTLPVLYLPYVDFPLDDRRKTGFLYPWLGYSNRTGWGMTLPFYWNWAPNRDVTLTPRVQSRRGILLETETRYLFPTTQGQWDAAFLPDDALYGDDRYALRWQQESQPHPRLRFSIDAGEVSDPDYLADFGTTLAERSDQAIERRASFSYALGEVLGEDVWQFQGRAQSFQILDTTAPTPYRRVPELRLTGQRQDPVRPGWALDTSLTRFEHPRDIEGIRMHSDVRIRHAREDWGYFFRPELRLLYTHYQLDAPSGESLSLNRALAGFQTDAGLFFDRPLGSGMVQTLEPRLFYGVVPFRNQEAIPLLDTAERRFTERSLFTLDRFSGPDRVGDTHQLTTAVTTRFLENVSGAERLQLTGARIQYFSPRRVRGHPTDPALEESASDWVLGGQLRLNTSWEVESQWFLDASDLQQRSAQTTSIRHRTRHRQWDLNYLFRREESEQIDASVFTPLGPRVSVLGRSHFDMDQQHWVELLAGLEYRSCCYTLRAAVSHSRVDRGNSMDTALQLQLTLDGLGQFHSGF